MEKLCQPIPRESVLARLLSEQMLPKNFAFAPEGETDEDGGNASDEAEEERTLGR